ncbi:MAG: aminotransferase class V-fold PLP-dependent enzyme, partial [Dehalococcoidia bacterium]
AAALWLKKGTRVIPYIDGGVQEGGKRAGTENVPAIVGMGTAAKLAQQDLQSRMAHLTALRDRLVEGTGSRVDRAILTGHPTRRLPGNASFCIEFIEGEAMLMLLSSKGIAASSGSSCTSRALKASHVLTAMGITAEIAQGSLVFSLGVNNSDEDVDYVLESLPPIVDRLRQMSPLYSKFNKERGRG